MNISILRTVFDKLSGRSLTRHLTTPKRRFPLPEVLSRGDIGNLLAAATSTRDQLILGLLYGCGLKVGELRALTWADIDNDQATLRVGHGRSGHRNLEIPPDLQPVLAYGKARCKQDDFIFQGRTPGTALSTRMIELIVRRARHAAGIIKPVTAMTLRHAYGVHCLESGDSVRAVQQALGHRSVKTTMIYTHCLMPEGLVSPIDRLRTKQRQAQEPEPDITPVAPPAPARPQQHLFAEPPSVQAIELPFRDETTASVSGFQKLLKTHILDRFLCRRRATVRDG